MNHQVYIHAMKERKAMNEAKKQLSEKKNAEVKTSKKEIEIIK